MKPLHKPRLTRLLQSIGLDVQYHRGQGDVLYFYDPQQREIEVLDFVGGYGSLLLGHACGSIYDEAQRILVQQRPIHAQGSIRGAAERLAQELARRAGGDYCATFANSGAEAVEAALKHAMLETGGRTFLVLEGGFHGKTLGAVQLASNPKHRKGFELPSLPAVHARLNDAAHLEELFATTPNLAGLFFEPVLGEGGVRLVEPDFARRMAQLCRRYGVPLIADECQTGVGRTGTFLGCEALGIQPDYIILSKSLGGGLAKISALLVQRKRYVDQFDLTHTSTFADDEFSCGIALKTLELVDDALLRTCREKGARLFRMLQELRASYPDVIVDVRGRGLMLGLEFHRLDHASSFLLRYLSCQEELIYALVGYLLNEHRIRLAPTLGDPFTVRLQPSAFIHDAQLDRLMNALDDACHRLARGDAPGLTTYLSSRGDVADDDQADETECEPTMMVYDGARFAQRQQSTPATRVAWLCHLIDADDLVSLEPALGELTFDQRQRLLDRAAPRALPVVMSAVDIRSRTGSVVRLYPILLPVTSTWMKRRMETRQHRIARAVVQRGVDAARRLGCSMVALGQYTSIVTRNGRKLDVGQMGCTTGNALAVSLVVQSLVLAEQQTGIDPPSCVLAIVGAAGNIGSTCGQILAPRYGQTILLGTPTTQTHDRLRSLSLSLRDSVITTDVDAIRAADVVVAATNSVRMPLEPHHFAPHALVCDVSVPPSIHPNTRRVRPDLTVIKGGIVRLPCAEDLEFVGFPLPRGETYACMAEGVLLALEGRYDSSFTGPLTPEKVRQVEQLAVQHGFELADFKTSCVLGSEGVSGVHIQSA